MTKNILVRLSVIFTGMILMGACSLQKSTPQVIYVTATSPVVSGASTQLRQDLSPVPLESANQPTPDPVRFADGAMFTSGEHIVQYGDTLSGIAVAYNTSLETLLTVNNLENPDSLYVGQVIRLPGTPDAQTPNFKIIPNSKLVRSPGSQSFDITTFVNQQPGYIRTATDVVDNRLADGSSVPQYLTAAQVVERVSIEYSVDARLLLAILEYRAGWLSNPDVPEQLKTHPLIAIENSGGFDRSGMYYQLAWLADRLNWGYYGWKYRGWTTVELADGTRLQYAQGLNAATVSVQYVLSLFTLSSQWYSDVSERGFYSTYYAYFGDPFTNAVEPLVPINLQQPQMTFPFQPGEIWFYTGGHHGGWGTGSGWAAIDFAPPDESQDGYACYVSDSWVTAVANGTIVRSENGTVILDLDGDGDETTGWTIMYLHIASKDRISAGTVVEVGAAIGHPSCEGGFSTATHMHIARRYNGEWIPADCQNCPSFDTPQSFIMSGWQVIGLQNQEYQGYLSNGVQQRIAEQGRLTTDNQISW